MSDLVNNEVLDCVDAFAALRRILRPECIEDIYNPMDGESRDGIDRVLDLPGVEFDAEEEVLEFDEVADNRIVFAPVGNCD